MSGGVGRSWRTVAKHGLMRSFVGQEVGVLAAKHAEWEITRAGLYDLTAGDGIAPDHTQWIHGCSPGILANHATHLPIPAVVRLHEIQPATYDRLLDSLATHLPTLGYTKNAADRWLYEANGAQVELVAINGSGSDADTSLIRWGDKDAVLTLNDPNAITEWAMRPTYAQEIRERTWCARSLSTMGCNPAGIKRLDISERLQWFDLIQAQQDALPPYRDLLLAAIERDEAQWAYLICDPGKWRAKTESVVRTAFSKVGRTVAMSWYRANPDQFEETKRSLFFTQRERRDMQQGRLL